jgi:hypothetical protein
MRERVHDGAKSERRVVMTRIGTETIVPVVKASRLAPGHNRENAWRTSLWKAKQMTASGNIGVDAAFTRKADWSGIDWHACCREVRKLQVRIAKAVREGCWRKVKALQWLLTHAFSAKALAVRRVTENQGKHTPGIDGVTWSTLQEKSEAIDSLKRRGYQPKPLRRIYIPKSNGRRRPLSIPVKKRPGDASPTQACARTDSGNNRRPE